MYKVDMLGSSEIVYAEQAVAKCPHLTEHKNPGQLGPVGKAVSRL
jgi:hypothetical protein